MNQPVPTSGVWASLGFLSWLSYAFFSGANHWLMAAVSGLLISSTIVAMEHRRRAVKLMDLTAASYFGAAVLAIVVGARELLIRYNLPMAWGIFAIVAWITIFRDQPFAQQYARENAPPALWQARLFHQMNRELSVIWAIIFSFGAALGVLALYVGHVLELGLVLPMTAMAAGLIFSRYYPRRYIARLTALLEPVPLDQSPRHAHN